jgi:hypothetical protein
MYIPSPTMYIVITNDPPHIVSMHDQVGMLGCLATRNAHNGLNVDTYSHFSHISRAAAIPSCSISKKEMGSSSGELTAIAGIKRKVSFPSSEGPSKRAMTESIHDHPPTALIYRCPTCHFPCWFCQVANGTWQAAPGPPSSPEFSSDSMSRGTRTNTSTKPSTVSRSKRKRADGLIFVAPEDRGFEENILLPCSIKKIYLALSDDFSPTAIFGEQPEIASSGAFLSFDKAELEKIAQQFMEYERRGDDENALSVLCKRKLLVDEDLPNPQGPVRILPLRKDRWRAQKPRPAIPSELYFFDWDVESDVTYAVSVN